MKCPHSGRRGWFHANECGQAQVNEVHPLRAGETANEIRLADSRFSPQKYGKLELVL